MNETYSKQILTLMKSKPKGNVFLYRDFFHIGKGDTLRKTLKRLVDTNKITRVFNGMFSILEYSALLKKDIYPAFSQIAESIARNYMWNIYPAGNTALNIVGLSTQVTNVYEYLSDGPYRKYNYLGAAITFKHSVNRKLKLKSNTLVVLVIALDHLGKDNVDESAKVIISNYIYKHQINKYIPNDVKYLPQWMYLLLDELVTKKHSVI